MCRIDRFAQVTCRLIDAHSLVDIDAVIGVGLIAAIIVIIVLIIRIRSKDVSICCYLCLLLPTPVPCGRSLPRLSLLVLLCCINIIHIWSGTTAQVPSSHDVIGGFR